MHSFAYEVVGLHAENDNGESRGDIVRKYLGDEDYKTIEVYLEREPENPYDKYAISVNIFTRGKHKKIGYLSKDSSKYISFFWDRGYVVNNVKIIRVWVPYKKHITPEVVISFDASWSEDDLNKLIVSMRGKNKIKHIINGKEFSNYDSIEKYNKTFVSDDYPVKNDFDFFDFDTIRIILFLLFIAFLSFIFFNGD